MDEYPLLKNNGRMSVEADGQTLSVIKYVEHSMVDEYPLLKNNGRMSVEAVGAFILLVKKEMLGEKDVSSS